MQRAAGGGALLEVRVMPRAGRSAIAGVTDGVVRVRLAAAPVDGAANAELVAVLARALDVRKQRIEIVSGLTSRDKRIRVAGLDRAAVLAALAAH